VTVAGESAGAACALMMAVSPSTTGLLHRVISMSGAPLAYPHAETARFAEDCFTALGVKPGDIEALGALDNKALFRLPLRRLLRANSDRYGAFGADGFATLVAATGTELFPLPAMEFLAQGRCRDIDLLIGTCRDEARLWTIALPLPDALAARAMFRLHAGVMNPRNRPRETLSAYRALMPGVSLTKVRERAMTDALFRKPSVEFANAVAGVHPGHAWLYRYDWKAQGLNGAFDAIHGVDLPALFETYGQMLEVLGPANAARAGGNVLHGALLSFIKTGKPEVPGVAWPPYDSQTKPCMIIDGVAELRRAVDAGFEEIW
jgi:para-nitrobenzyl esterase